MFKSVQKKLNKVKRSANNKGQVAILIIFVVAVALIIFAITANVSKMSQSKTIVTKAAELGTADMASAMASYGQNLYETQLGAEGGFEIDKKTGKEQVRRCESGNFVEFLIQLATLAALMFLAPHLIGAYAQIFNSTLLAQIVVYTTIILQAASIIINVTVIQPGITEMWNRIQRETMSETDQFLESEE